MLILSDLIFAGCTVCTIFGGTYRFCDESASACTLSEWYLKWMEGAYGVVEIISGGGT